VCYYKKEVYSPFLSFCGFAVLWTKAETNYLKNFFAIASAVDFAVFAKYFNSINY
jgi:hypothetical protein